MSASTPPLSPHNLSSTKSPPGRNAGLPSGGGRRYGAGGGGGAVSAPRSTSGESTHPQLEENDASTTNVRDNSLCDGDRSDGTLPSTPSAGVPAAKKQKCGTRSSPTATASTALPAPETAPSIERRRKGRRSFVKEAHCTTGGATAAAASTRTSTCDRKCQCDGNARGGECGPNAGGNEHSWGGDGDVGRKPLHVQAEAQRRAEELLASFPEPLPFNTDESPSWENLGLPADCTPEEARQYARVWLEAFKTRSGLFKDCEHFKNIDEEIDYLLWWVDNLQANGKAYARVQGLCGTPGNEVNLCCGANNDCPNGKHKSCTTVKAADKIVASLEGLVQFDTRSTSRYPVDWANVRPFCPLTREQADSEERWTCPYTALIEAWIKAATTNIMIWLCGKLGIDFIFIAVGGVGKGIDRVVALLDKPGIKVLVGPLCHAQFLENGLTPRAADDARTLNDALVKYCIEKRIEQRTTFAAAVNIEWLEKKCAYIAEKMKAGRERRREMDAIRKMADKDRSPDQRRALALYDAEKVRIPALRERLASGKELTPEEHERLAIHDASLVSALRHKLDSGEELTPEQLEKLAAADRKNERTREQRAKDRAKYDRIKGKEERLQAEQGWLDMYEAKREQKNEQYAKDRAKYDRIKSKRKRLQAEQDWLDMYEAKREQKNEAQNEQYAKDRAKYDRIKSKRKRLQAEQDWLDAYEAKVAGRNERMREQRAKDRAKYDRIKSKRKRLQAEQDWLDAYEAKVTGAKKWGVDVATGRWTEEEHGLFLQGLEQHGKDWMKIDALIKSRSLAQIRSHAQKYFQSLKAKERLPAEQTRLDPSVSPAEQTDQAKAHATATQALYETLGYPAGAARAAANALSLIPALAGTVPDVEGVTVAAMGAAASAVEGTGETSLDGKPSAEPVLAHVPQVRLPPLPEEVGSDKYIESLRKYAMEQTALAYNAAAPMGNPTYELHAYAANAAIQAMNWHKMMKANGTKPAAVP